MMATPHALFDGAQSGVVHVITPCDVSRAPLQQQQASLQAPTLASRLGLRSQSAIPERGARDTSDYSGDDDGGADDDFAFTLSVVRVCGMRFELFNTHIRIACGLVLMPTLLALAWYLPVQATVLLVTLAAVVGYFEFAWIAFRIQSRLLETYRYYEGDESKSEQRRRQATRVTVALHRDTRATSTGLMLVRSVAEQQQLQQQQAAVPPLAKIYAHNCAVRFAAEKLFCGNRWTAALALALPLAGLLILIDVFVVEQFIVAELPIKQLSTDTFRWLFLLSTRYAASIGALLCPNWEFVVLLIFELGAFSIMTAQTLVCPMGNFVCPARGDSEIATVTVFTTLAVAAMGILLLSALSSIDAIEIVIKSMLRLVGFVVVFGLALAILSLVDSVAVRASRGFLVALLVVTWMGHCSAFSWNLVRKSIRWGESPRTPTRTHADPRRDIECTLIAIGSGALLMAVLTQLITMPRGSVGVHIAVAVGAIFVGRMADLMLGILKKAAGVRRSGALIPGLGGVLDQVVALSAAALVFAQYAGQL